MAKIVFQDEEGLNLNWYKLVAVEGQTGVYALERVATITKQGTPYNKEVGDHFLQVEDKGVAGGVANYDDTVPNTRKVAGKALSSDIVLGKTDVGLGNVDNIADASKSVNYANSAGTSNLAHYSSHAVGSGGAALRNNTATVGGSPSGGSDGDGWDICT